MRDCFLHLLAGTGLQSQMRHRYFSKGAYKLIEETGIQLFMGS